MIPSPGAARRLAAFAALFCLAAAPADGTLEAHWRLGGEPLVLRSRPEDAGAISSLVFRGREFIAGREKGWLLQGAGVYGPAAECFNPTLAGSRFDPPGATSSRLLAASVDTARFHTSTRMAFWTPPGRRCTDARGVRTRAWNATALSDTVYTQTLTPGFGRQVRAIDDHVVITSPRPAATASFEVLTGYLPAAAFSALYAFDAGSRRLVRLRREDMGVERFEPEVAATPDGRFAMGIVAISPLENARYAALQTAEVSKWSLVYHYPSGLPAGAHRFQCVLLLGTRDEVLASLDAITAAQGRERLLRAAPWLAALLAAAALVSVLAAARGRGALKPI